ncbi:methyltransferase family protein [Roseisalinus antarcticus]|uniref:Isoprenylcysteine carboxyl methyltransferase (ICMT) family protein n=1 Tax=Roseisalinus antarcticus TaxID=254357 RepID=A0A1Y5SL81_9RHOB|nr:isoprenylcysteine carboxylmethyltransferase family protein [Roseisalinus antarcticus]SLN40409.1 hypothetical protein ROA7023_01576 [Roseisalinus antarcticus]
MPKMPLWKWIDIPPVWLLAHLLGAWQIRQLSLPGFGGPWADFAGGLLVGGGLILMGLALIELRKGQTTPIPHQQADHLVQTGIYRRSRNPIYLGDALLLTGVILYWGVAPALLLVPLFVTIITRRFILPEEDALRRKFRKEFFRYTQRTRRWI